MFSHPKKTYKIDVHSILGSSSGGTCDDGQTNPMEGDPDGGNCDLGWDYLQSSGQMGWTHFGNVPDNDNPQFMSCGRCVRAKTCEVGAEETIIMMTGTSSPPFKF